MSDSVTQSGNAPQQGRQVYGPQFGQQYPFPKIQKPAPIPTPRGKQSPPGNAGTPPPAGNHQGPSVTRSAKVAIGKNPTIPSKAVNRRTRSK